MLHKPEGESADERECSDDFPAPELARVRDEDVDSVEISAEQMADLDLTSKKMLRNKWFFDKMVYIIRHGEPECLDGVLNARGVEQVRALRKRWPSTFPKIQVIFTSPFASCMETAYRAFKSPEKMEVNPYIMSVTAGRLQKFHGEKVLAAPQTKRLLDEYRGNWTPKETSSEPLDGFYETDPDGMGNFARTAAQRWEHFVDELMVRNETMVAIVTHSPQIEMIVGSDSNIHMHKGSLIVRGFKDGRFVHPDQVNDRIYDDAREIGDTKDPHWDDIGR